MKRFQVFQFVLIYLMKNKKKKNLFWLSLLPSISPQRTFNSYSFFKIFLGMFLIFSLGVCPRTAVAEKINKGDQSMEPELIVQPQQVLIGDPIRIQVNNLSANQMVKLTVTGQDQLGNIWTSEATFQAKATGIVDISTDAPVEGSYQGVDQAGLFWSMTCKPTGEYVSPFAVIRFLTVTLMVDGEKKVSQNIERIAYQHIEQQNLTEPIVGVFFKPQEITQPTPALIVLGGSEGGYNQGWAAVLASKTRMPTLALAYFGLEGLPSTLENIPLETIQKAIDWLNQQPTVKKDCFGLIGASRGGELAILAASIFPQIKAVVGYTPSGIIWEGIGNQNTSAWTFQGKPFPYLRVMISDEMNQLFLEAQKNGTVYFNAPSFLYSLKMQQSQIPEATIPVENSKAAFLLIGNPQDGVWPSDVLSKMTIDRLQENNYPHPYELLSYNNGGHMLIPYPYYPTTMRKFYLPTVKVWEGLGGTAKDAAKAAENSWPKVIDFLYRELEYE